VTSEKIIRIFPRKTAMTPTGENVRVWPATIPTMFDEADRIEISVTFTSDIRKAEQMAAQWEYVAPVSIGGPAYNDRGGEFIPGKYVKEGNVVTHRGCPNSCWFCDAWKREGREIRELTIHDGYNLLDNNILACSVSHQEKVYQMLLQQPQRIKFTGGLEAARFTKWNVEWLSKLKPEYAYFAYDEHNDWEPLVEAVKLLREYELLKNHSYGCYVLVGYPKDTFEDAEMRLIDVVHLGLMPQAMLLDRAEKKSEAEQKQWQRFQREWANKVIVGSKMAKINKENIT
jgi:hypothetical protein